MKEYAIGEIFEHDGVMLEVVEDGGCRECFFKNKTCGHMKCSQLLRSDKKWVIAKQVKNQLTHEQLLKMDGVSVECEIRGIKITDAKIRVENGEIFICQNIVMGSGECDYKNGYEYSWFIGNKELKYQYNGTCKNIKVKLQKKNEIPILGGQLVYVNGYDKRAKSQCGTSLIYRGVEEIDEILLDNFKKIKRKTDLTYYERMSIGFQIHIETDTKKIRPVSIFDRVKKLLTKG